MPYSRATRGSVANSTSEQRSSHRAAVGDVAVAAVLFGTTGTAQALGPSGTTPLTVGAARIVIGGGALVVIALRRGLRASLKAVVRSPAGLLAGACTAIYQLLFFVGTARAGVAIATVITIGSAPVMTGLLGVVFLGYRVSRVWMLSTAIAVTGLVLLAAGGSSGGEANVWGLLAALGSGAGYAGYTLAGKFLIDTGVDSLAVMAASFGLGGVILLPVLVFGGSAWLATGSGLALALYLGLVPTAAAYIFYGKGLAVLPANTVATLVLIEPVVATLLAVVVVGERLTPLAWVGIALVMFAISIIARASMAPVRLIPSGGRTGSPA